MLTWQDIPVALTLASSIFTVGAAFGLYVRRGQEQDRRDQRIQAELDQLWHHKNDCEADRRRLSERIIESGGPAA